MACFGRLFGRDGAAGPSLRPAPELAVTWAATTKTVLSANLGDALSPVIVAGLSGRRVRHAHFDEDVERIAALGTIGQDLHGGILHLWGTGAQRRLWPVDGEGRPRHPGGIFHVHATRGPLTRAVLRDAGIEAPEVYGDPAPLLPRLFPMTPEPVHDLGIIPHVSELDAVSPDARPKADILRYRIPPEMAGRVRLIPTWTLAEPVALFACIRRILSCRRIISASLHGLVIAEAFGIPALALGKKGRGATAWDLTGPCDGLDHRMIDYGLGKRSDPPHDLCPTPCERDRLGGCDRGGRSLRLSPGIRPRALAGGFPLQGRRRRTHRCRGLAGAYRGDQTLRHRPVAIARAVHCLAAPAGKAVISAGPKGEGYCR